MKIFRVYKYKYIGVLMLACALASAMASCSDGAEDPDSFVDGSDIEFKVSLLEEPRYKTRALDSTLISVEPYNMDFHMEMRYNDSENNPKTDFRLYRIQSGQEGRLFPKDGTEAFKWHGLTSNHTFWGWTKPWENVDDGIDWATNYSDGTDYPEELRPLLLTFFNSGENDENDYEKYRNNDIYETLIGTKRGPVDYYHNGKYVELTYKHLVSKIVIKRLTLYMSDGSIQHDVKGNITFFGMPHEAVFYPHPAGDGAPVVNTIFDSYGELTYHISSNNLFEDVLYVCPEIDFSQLGFYIDITDDRYKEYGDHGDYYGSFKNVQFIREPGVDFDSPNGRDDTVLHAGEMMELNIELYPGFGPGMTVHIRDWSTARSGDAVHHSNRGIYTNSDASSFQKNADWENLYELYGSDQKFNGKDEFKIYDNVIVDSNTFPVGPGYIFNGMGHLLTMKSSSNKITIGDVRDIYITDGKTTIYIDADGVIWSMTARNVKDKKIGELKPLENGNYLYQIELTSGKVTQTK